MCPFCISAAAATFAGTASAGGLLAIVAKRLRAKPASGAASRQPNPQDHSTSNKEIPDEERR